MASLAPLTADEKIVPIEKLAQAIGLSVDPRLIQPDSGYGPARPSSGLSSTTLSGHVKSYTCRLPIENQHLTPLCIWADSTHNPPMETPAPSDLRHRLRQILSGHGGVRLAILFGSQVTGRAAPHSDLDPECLEYCQPHLHEVFEGSQT